MNKIFDDGIKNLKTYKGGTKCKIISIEGIDGSGKTTVIENSIKLLREKGYKVEYFSPIIEYNNFWKIVKEYVLSQKEITKFEVNQSLHNICFLTFIDSYLDELQNNYDFLFTDWFFCGKMVLSELFTDKKNNFSKRIILDYLDTNKYIFSNNVSYYMDIDPKEAYLRIQKRNGEKEVKESLEMLIKASEIWKDYIEKYNITKINTDIGSVEIAKRIVKELVNKGV